MEESLRSERVFFYLVGSYYDDERVPIDRLAGIAYHRTGENHNLYWWLEGKHERYR